MKKLLFLLMPIIIASCSKDELICGLVTGGDYDAFNNMYYLRVDSRRYWVDMKTYDSYLIGDEICLESW